MDSCLPECPDTILQLLIAVANHTPSALTSLYGPYYKYLKALLFGKGVSGSEGLNHDSLLPAITTPLAEHGSAELSSMDCLLFSYFMILIFQLGKARIAAYSAFALEFLTSPELSSSHESLADLANNVNLDLLSGILVQEFSSVKAEQIPPERRIWLLGHFIALHRLQNRSKLDPEFLRALSLQLSSSASSIMGSISLSSLEGLNDATESDDESAKNTPTQLHPFIREQLLSLVDQASITGLLSKFNVDQNEDSTAVDEDASLLSSYALTLLRMFPSRVS